MWCRVFRICIPIDIRLSNSPCPVQLRKRFSHVITDFGLIYPKHQSIEDSRREIVVVDLVALVRGLRPVVVKKKQEPIS
jgi:hypothetical protein